MKLEVLVIPVSDVDRAKDPGSFNNMHLVVSDIEVARDELFKQGVEVTQVFHCGSGAACRFDAAGTQDRVEGRAPDHKSYSSFATFGDPDGNGWVIQEITSRLPGRVEPKETSYSSSGDLASAMRRASQAHGEHEKRIRAADPNWPDWYAEYMVSEQAGSELPV